MKSVVIYDSQYGNTQALAEAIAAELKMAGAVEVENARTGTVELPSDLGLLVVGGPTQAHGMTRPLRTRLDSFTSHRLDGVAAATFDTRARGPRFLTGAASRGIARRLEQKARSSCWSPGVSWSTEKRVHWPRVSSSAPVLGHGTSSPNWLWHQRPRVSHSSPSSDLANLLSLWELLWTNPPPESPTAGLRGTGVRAACRFVGGPHEAAGEFRVVERTQVNRR
jgi:flavodoxin